MIAQPILAVPAAKTASAPQQQQQLQSANANGFLALLTATDPTLTAIAQATGAATPSVAPANINKPAKPSDASAAAASLTSTTPYVAPPAAPAPTTATTAATAVAAATTNILPPADLSATINGNALPPSAFLAAANAAIGNAAQNGPASAAQTTDTSQATTTAPTGNGNSTAFGDQINARVAAGAPIYASQPTATMATIAPHLLDAAAPHPQPGAVPDKAGSDSSGKPSIAANATPASAVEPANSTPTTPQPQLPPPHVAANDANGSFSNNGNAAPATTAASDNASAAGSNAGDAGAASVPLLAQSNAPLASTPAQVDAAVHTAAPYVPVGEQVALNLKQAMAADSNEIRIQLKPASLGTIDVKLNLTQDGRVSAVITADRSDTLNMLKQDSGTLQQGLRDAGLNADNGSLSFGLRGDSGQSFAQNSSQGGSGHSGGGYYRSSVADALIGARSAAPAQRFHSGSLDIEV